MPKVFYIENGGLCEILENENSIRRELGNPDPIVIQGKTLATTACIQPDAKSCQDCSVFKALYRPITGPR